MTLAIGSARLERCLDAIYDAAVEAKGWTMALTETAALFGAGFADICTWTPDRAHVSGTCVGLDGEDYEEQLLGFWFNRNVWGKTRPVRVAGEVISTRQMVPREELSRSEMYHDYLEPRGLHEGLRLSLWVDTESLADISLLRPWSGGAFGPADVALGRALLPHLQRAALLTRRLRQAEFRLTYDRGGAPGDGVAVVALDRTGVPIWCNRVAEAVLSSGNPFRLTPRGLRAGSTEVTHRLAQAVSRAIGQPGTLRTAGTVRIPWGESSSAMTVVVQPVSERQSWPMPRAPAALLLFREPSAGGLGATTLQGLFGLTAAEAQTALDLKAGLTLQEIAARTGRSWNTVRKHLASVLTKTERTRQVDLLRLLNELEWVGASDLGDPPRIAPGGARRRGVSRPPTRLT